MSSSKGSRSKGSQGRSSSSPFPKPWSNWEWNAQWQCETRYRVIAATGRPDKDYEYDYRSDPQAPRDQEAISSNLPSIPEAPTNQVIDSSATGDNYTFGVDVATEALARTTLSSSGGRSQGHMASSGNISSHSTQRPRTASIERRIYTRDDSTTTDLDPAFKLHSSWEFSFGRVFKVLWSEPQGSKGTEITRVRKSKYGEDAYDSIRRFVVVDPREGHCICLPILTYGGQGTTKKGVHDEDHAMIYTGQAPPMLKKERITKKSIRMEPLSQRHKLDETSRINYAKLYTVEHNVKVQFVGTIARKYQQQLVTDYNETHRPLPDRPFVGGTTQSTFEHAQGPDPEYSIQAPGTATSWQPIPSSATPALFSSGSVGYSATSSSFPTTTQTSSYPAVVTSTIGPVQTTSYPLSYPSVSSNAPAQPDSYTVSGPSNDEPLYEDDLYGPN